MTILTPFSPHKKDMIMIEFYTRPQCSQCKRVAQVLNTKHIPYTTINIDTIPPEQLDGFRQSGLRSLPIIVVKDERDQVIESWAGSNAQKMDELCKSSIIAN